MDEQQVTATEVSTETPSADTGTVDVDSLLSSIETSSPRERPMTQAPQAPTQTQQEYELNVGGKVIKAPIDKLTKWAQMGYDAPNRIGELNSKLAEYTQKEKQFQEIAQRYQPIDEYVRKNPEFWQHVQKSWEQRQQEMQADSPVVSELMQLKNEIGEIKQFKDQIIQQQVLEKRTQEDSALKTEIESIRKQYSNLDFDTPDAEGKTLEYQVLEYAHTNGIPTFKAAFRDFYHDHLVKMAEQRGREAVSKDIQKRTKMGLVGTSPTPKKTLSQATDVKSKSYEDLLSEALAESGVR